MWCLRRHKEHVRCRACRRVGGSRTSLTHKNLSDEKRRRTHAPTFKLIFRDLFIEEKDAQIAKIVSNYFDAVAQRWPSAWNSEGAGDVLNKTLGFSGLMRFLGPVYRDSCDSQGRLSSHAALKILRRIQIRDSEFTTEKYRPGGTGLGQLFRDLREQSRLE